jgi:hypothetical protein
MGLGFSSGTEINRQDPWQFDSYQGTPSGVPQDPLHQSRLQALRSSLWTYALDLTTRYRSG